MKQKIHSPGRSQSHPWASHLTLAIVAAAVMIGILIGVGISSNVVSTPQNVASSQFIDAMAPNPQLCVQYGASAVTLDARFFVTFNPFSVYVSRPQMQPGCVVRSNDWAILQQKNLLTADQQRECKDNMNTFGFTGNLESSPQIDCVYRNDAAGNLFLKPGKSRPGSHPA